MVLAHPSVLSHLQWWTIAFWQIRWIALLTWVYVSCDHAIFLLGTDHSLIKSARPDVSWHAAVRGKKFPFFTDTSQSAKNSSPQNLPHTVRVRKHDDIYLLLDKQISSRGVIDYSAASSKTLWVLKANDLLPTALILACLPFFGLQRRLTDSQTNTPLRS